MTHPNFCEFLEKCNYYNFSVNVLSNLTLLNDKIIDIMKSYPLLGVQTSLYSMNADIHDEITQMKGSYQKTKDAIDILIENNIPLQISCPIMRQNKKSYNEVIKWAKKRNIHVGNDYIIIARYDHSIENLRNRLTIDEIEEVIKDIIAEDDSYLNKIELEANTKSNMTSNDYVCSICHSSICITELGNLYPCAGWQGYNIGSIKNNTLADIWNNSDKIKYLRGLRNKNFPECVQCSDKKFCTMCMVRNANEDPLGNPLTINKHFCKIASLNKKILYEWKEKMNE